MSEELQLTRRRLLQAVTAIAATAAFTVQARDTLDADQVLEAELIDDTPADARRSRRRRCAHAAMGKKAHAKGPCHHKYLCGCSAFREKKVVDRG